MFGKIAQQNITNEYVLKKDILGNIGITEKTLVGSIMDSLTSFSNLNTVNLSCNNIGDNGLEVLVNGLAGCQIEFLNISSCGIDLGFYTLEKLGLKCRRLKELDLNNNTCTRAWIFSMLLNNDVYPCLRKLDINSMGINDDMIEVFSSSLRDNRSVRYLNMCNYTRRTGGLDNVIGRRGVAALCKVVHDTSSFKNTLSSNDIVWKISIDENIDSNSNLLYKTCLPNYRSRNKKDDDRSRYRLAWEKHADFIAYNDNADMTPFMELEIELLPHLLSRFYPARDIHYKWGSFAQNEIIGLTALYKIFSCKMFIERLESAALIRKLKAKNNQFIAKISHLEIAQVQDKKKQENLEEGNAVLMAENKKLREQIAKLTIDNANQSEKHQENDQTTWSGSIAERVKRRTNSRKKKRGSS